MCISKLTSLFLEEACRDGDVDFVLHSFFHACTGLTVSMNHITLMYYHFRLLGQVFTEPGASVVGKRILHAKLCLC